METTMSCTCVDFSDTSYDNATNSKGMGPIGIIIVTQPEW